MRSRNQPPLGVVCSTLFSTIQRPLIMPPTAVIAATAPGTIRPTRTEYSSNEAPPSSFQRRAAVPLMQCSIKFTPLVLSTQKIWDPWDDSPWVTRSSDGLPRHLPRTFTALSPPYPRTVVVSARHIFHQL